MLHVITRSILLLLCLILYFTLTSLPPSHLICTPSSHPVPLVPQGPLHNHRSTWDQDGTGRGAGRWAEPARQVGGAVGCASAEGPRLLPLYRQHLRPGPLSLGRGPHGFLGLRGLHHHAQRTHLGAHPQAQARPPIHRSDVAVGQGGGCAEFLTDSRWKGAWAHGGPGPACPCPDL